MKRNKLINTLPFFIILTTMFSLMYFNNGTNVKNIKYNEYVSILKDGKITEAKLTYLDNVINVSGKYKEEDSLYAETTTIVKNNNKDYDATIKKFGKDTTNLEMSLPTNYDDFKKLNNLLEQSSLNLKQVIKYNDAILVTGTFDLTHENITQKLPFTEKYENNELNLKLIEDKFKNGKVEEVDDSMPSILMESNNLSKILESDNVKDAKIISFNDGIILTTKYLAEDSKSIMYQTTLPNTTESLTLLEENVEEAQISVVDGNMRSPILEFIIGVLPMLLLCGAGFYMFSKVSQGGNSKAFEFSKSRAKLEADIRVRFDDVAGCDEEKEEMAEIIDYLKSPKKFEKAGARIPKGILMVGSPGTGKTLLAKAVAGEADVPFYSISGSDFVEMFVGVGASRVRDMFKKAKATAPCMIFIDEIDAVGRQRGAGMGGGHDEREQTLNQLLVEMDGITDNAGIVIIAATNRPDVLDSALLRPGRFDRQITVALPDRKGRTEILKVHARNKKLSADIDLEALAKRTPGFSGADLENVLNEASILSVRYNKKMVGMEELDEAIDRVMMGPAKKSRVYDEQTKKLVAYHEAGHAIIGLFLDNASVVQKVTIIPRGTAGGYNLMTPKEDKMMHTRNDLMATITSYMGGRCAEELFFDDVTTGASNDIENATKIARDMVTIYGMSDLGPVQYDRSSQNVFLGRDYNSHSNVSADTASSIDEEIRKIIEKAHQDATNLVVKHKQVLIDIAEALIEYETLTSEQIDRIVKGLPVYEEPKNQTLEITKEDLISNGDSVDQTTEQKEDKENKE